MTATTDALKREIEALRTAEQRLVRERAELEQRVRELNEALERATAEAIQAHAKVEEAHFVRDNWLSKISHELRTPLQGMLSWSQILERVALDPERVRNAAGRVVANVLAQVCMLDDLLDISRVLSGKLRLQPERFDLALVIQSAVDAVSSSNTETDVSIEVEVGEAPLWIRADPARTEQVVRNLTSNAVRDADAGGRVHIECFADATHVTVRVRDWGRGIEAEDLPYVFEPFRPSRRSRNPHQGLGLGLAIARHIVEHSGGDLSVQSDGPGFGATFTLRLPRADEALADDAPRLPQDTSPQGGAILMSAAPTIAPICRKRSHG